ncbi:AraC family ligand binding domain-containing protein [Paenibacillus septentrionalis]|uniref:AraC family ligand binding domain-containing protein n=1 Tax=Paenibacillus septentrionalis TaxID=429342 RepID=A0ABW1V1U4_9BACL
MKKELRSIVYDTDLNVEAYHFAGIMQKFPNHFHEYFVIGFIESGKRFLSCKHQEYIVMPGDLLLFNPLDNHACEQVEGEALDYRAINVQPEVIRKAALDITGKDELPYFKSPVGFRSELVPVLRELHQMMMLGDREFRKEELFYFLMQQLIEDYADQQALLEKSEQSVEVTMICEYLREHYKERITLDHLSKLTGLSKYYLLRSFTKQKGISPYSYLETLRISKAKKLLEKGIMPIDAALETGFVDQSHFTNFFKKFIGLTPKQYMNIFK